MGADTCLRLMDGCENGGNVINMGKVYKREIKNETQLAQKARRINCVERKNRVKKRPGNHLSGLVRETDSNNCFVLGESQNTKKSRLDQNEVRCMKDFANFVRNNKKNGDQNEGANALPNSHQIPFKKTFDKSIQEAKTKVPLHLIGLFEIVHEFQMRGHYLEACQALFKLPLVKEEFLPGKSTFYVNNSKMGQFLYKYGFVLPTVLKIITHAILTCNLPSTECNMIMGKMFECFQLFLKFSINNTGVNFASNTELMMYDLHYQPEVLKSKFSKLKMTRLERKAGMTLKMKMSIDFGSYLVWRNNDGSMNGGDEEALLESLRDHLKEENVMDCVPLVDAFIHMSVKLKKIKDTFGDMVRIAKEHPGLISHIATRLDQLNDSERAYFISNCLEYTMKLHPSHESWVTYVQMRSLHLKNDDYMPIIMENIKILINLLDFGKWSMNDKVWYLLHLNMFSRKCNEFSKLSKSK
uniref:MIF4G domain-containing protein n=1 Tax=Rhabditophanes sp. KR3021 TaxID=114890 RepID=A0AC35UA36_9BILA